MKIWITRAEPGAAATAERLHVMGHQSLVLPLLEARAAPARLAPDGVGAVAFTSAQGVRFFLEAAGGLGAEAAHHPWRALPVFAVGDGTARAAARAGFTDVTSAAGDVDALADLILSRAPSEGMVLHPGAAELAGDLVGALRAGGIEARRVAVYGTAPVGVSDEALAEATAADVVLVHSPRGARILAELLLRRPAPGLIAICMSQAVAAPLADVSLKAVLVAVEPSEASLLALLDSVVAEAAGSADPAPAQDAVTERVRLLTPLFWAMILLSAAGMLAAAVFAVAVTGAR